MVHFIKQYQMIGKIIWQLNILVLKVNKNLVVYYLFQKEHHLIYLNQVKKNQILNYMFEEYLLWMIVKI